MVAVSFARDVHIRGLCPTCGRALNYSLDGAPPNHGDLTVCCWCLETLEFVSDGVGGLAYRMCDVDGLPSDDAKELEEAQIRAARYRTNGTTRGTPS